MLLTRLRYAANCFECAPDCEGDIVDMDTDVSNPIDDTNLTVNLTASLMNLLGQLQCKSNVCLTDIQTVVESMQGFLEDIAGFCVSLIVAGDLNINVTDNNCINASHLVDILTSFDCVRRVTGETQIRGGAIDHFITRSSDVISDLYVGPPGAVPDHSLITWTLPFTQRHPLAERKALRRWKMVDRNRLKQSILNSELCAEIPQTSTAESLFDTYETILRDISDELAPANMTTIRRQPIAAWFDDESRLLRRKSRLLERRYRRTGLASD